ncbi:ABC transporter substrate-binding protein [Fodinicola acaciae]|uniref:ABC transporter substrate-binding protein n=1 Tax=Fodinicola acaciae TaxID=2681555 RepID=UPI0013D4B7EB|nr:ABC transporter substrate-binding protein [Fodinicola acaciae]
MRAQASGTWSATRQVVAILCVMALAAGCAGRTGAAVSIPADAPYDSRPVASGGTLAVAITSDADALDPTTSTTFVGREVFINMCEKLYDVDGKLAIVPQLASALPEMSADQKTATIRLRSGVLFNDGTPLTAAAVKRSLDRHRSKKDSARSKELGAVESVDVVDPLTVRLHLSRPFAPLTAQLADRAGMIMSPAALDRYGDNFGAHPVCVGPFAFASRVSGSQIVLTRSAFYYDKAKVRLEKLVYTVITDANVRAANLKSGDVQLAERVAPSDVPLLVADGKVKVLSGGTIGYQAITINLANVKGSTAKPGVVNTPLARDVRLRQAFELSLDRQVINRVVFNGLYDPDCSPLPRKSVFRDPARKCTTRDVARAKALVASTGAPTPVPVRMLVTATPINERLGAVIQGMAKDAGFDVTIVPTEFVTSLALAKAGNFDAIQVGWSGRVDPDGNLNGQVNTGATTNYGLIHDPEVDNGIKAAAATADVAQRQALYKKVVDRLMAIDGNIYLYHERYFLGVSDKVAGIRYYADGLPRLTTAGYAKADT